MKALPRRLIVVNSLGALGYLLLLVGYTLVLSLFVVLLFGSSAPEPTVPIIESSSETTADSSPLLLVLAVIIAAIMTVVTVAILITIPYFVGKLFSLLLYKTAAMLKMTPTLKNIFLLKCAVAFKVLVLFFVINFFSSVAVETRHALMVTTIIVCVGAIGTFALQLLVARGRNLRAW